ncbi:MAG TPA: glutathione S-transferase family protein [Caulobacteraceae bacterium]|jgi:glutathione S-transferase|nr:glutathione S-transferase family protein [Caulobacteraceae bacterium]
MTLELYAHPFSSYCQKVFIAFHENDTPFTLRMVDQDHPDNGARLAALWPLLRFPVLVDGERTIVESSAIIEHLAARYPGAATLIPAEPDAAVRTRMMDRIFDNYVMTPMQKIVGDSLRPEADRDAFGVAEARRTLDTAYGWLDGVMATRTWASGEAFDMADCAAAPSLFFADWAHGIDAKFGHLRAYRARLLARPSVARAVDGARPYRAFFPLGAPDRD